MRSRPDLLVLGGGGVLGEAWTMGVLAGIEDGAGFDLRECDGFLGTSAGSIVATHLASGRSPRRPSAVSDGLALDVAEDPGPGTGLAVAAAGVARRAGGVALALGATLAPFALGASAPGGALVRSTILRGLPTPREDLGGLGEGVRATGASFDGRLRIAAVERRSGRRVVFGSPRAPAAEVAEAVEASCAVPWLFAPKRIGGRDYVDGGVWSPTNLDAAPATRGSHVLCLNPTASLATTHALLALALGVSRSAVSVEALALRRRGARVRTVAPDGESSAAMGGNVMDPAPRVRVLAAGYRQGLALGGEG